MGSQRTGHDLVSFYFTSLKRLRKRVREGNGNPLHYSCLENPMDRGAWWATVSGVAESDMTEQLSLSLFKVL